MKNLEFLYTARRFALFTYFVLLGSVMYIVFPSYFANHDLTSYVFSAGFNFIFYGALFFFILRKTMKMQWLILIVVVAAICTPFVDYFEIEHQTLNMIRFVIFLLVITFNFFILKKDDIIQDKKTS